MSSESPAVILYSSDGYELAVVPGSALPTQPRAILIDGTDGTNSRTMLVDTSGRLNVVGAAAAGAAPSGNPLYVGASVTTAAPTYTTGTVNALSLTTTGLLRVDGTGGVFNNQSVSGTAATTPSFATLSGGAVTTAAPTYTTGQMDPLSLDTAGNLRTLANQGLAGTLAQSWFTRISDGTNGPAAVKPASTAAVATDPALVVAISPNNSITTTNSANGNPSATPPTQATYVGALVGTTAPTWVSGNMDPFSLTTAGLLRIDGVYPSAAAVAAGADTMYVGGAVTTAAPTYTTGQMDPLSLDTLGNLRVLATQGLAGTLAQSWFTRISDGTNGPAAVKPASTAAVATDPALVVAISPNNTITTTNGSVSNVAATPPAQATYMGASVTTAAPTYTTGQMDPLSLTTSGLLRIDGVYPINATTPTSDVTFVGGAVTTAAPTYTTGQLSAFSLTTAGQLRIDAAYPTGTVTASAPDMQEVGGIVTTAAPTYTTGQVNALSLDTAGNLRVAGSFVIDKSSTGTITSVAASATSATVLASNAARVGAAIYNDSANILYLALSASAASLTAFTIRIMPNSYYDLPVDYTGQINGIWNGNVGSARVTEFT
jgi:hypothetical protein